MEALNASARSGWPKIPIECVGEGSVWYTLGTVRLSALVVYLSAFDLQGDVKNIFVQLTPISYCEHWVILRGILVLCRLKKQTVKCKLIALNSQHA